MSFYNLAFFVIFEHNILLRPYGAVDISAKMFTVCQNV